jgi:type IV secretory pathway TrbD component
MKNKDLEGWGIFIALTGFVFFIIGMSPFNLETALIGIGFMFGGLVLFIIDTNKTLKDMAKKDPLIFTVYYRKQGRDCKKTLTNQFKLDDLLKKLYKKRIKYNVTVKQNEE